MLITYIKFVVIFSHLQGISSSIPPDVQSGVHKVYVEDRHAITLTCTMTENYGSNYAVEYIHFEKHEKYVDGHPYHRVVSNTSVQLHIPHVTYDEWRGHIVCAVPDMTEQCKYGITTSSMASLMINVISKYTYSWSS